jgi:hypothetical protein
MAVPEDGVSRLQLDVLYLQMGAHLAWQFRVNRVFVLDMVDNRARVGAADKLQATLLRVTASTASQLLTASELLSRHVRSSF